MEGDVCGVEEDGESREQAAFTGDDKEDSDNSSPFARCHAVACAGVPELTFILFRLCLHNYL